MKNSEIFILKTTSDILCVAKHLSVIHKFMLSTIAKPYHQYLLSYVQYSRYLSRYKRITISIPFSPPLNIENHICYGKFPKQILQEKPIKDIKILRERNCSAGTQQVG